MMATNNISRRHPASRSSRRRKNITLVVINVTRTAQGRAGDSRDLPLFGSKEESLRLTAMTA